LLSLFWGEKYFLTHKSGSKLPHSKESRRLTKQGIAPIIERDVNLKRRWSSPELPASIYQSCADDSYEKKFFVGISAAFFVPEGDYR